MFDKMFYHKPANGAPMPIAAMDDNHLLNMIALIADKMARARAAMTATDTLNEYERALYGVQPYSAAQVAEVVREGMGVLMPYVFEAALRGLNVAPDLQAAIGRTGALGGVPAIIDREYSLP